MRTFAIFLALSFLCFNMTFADNIIWRGDVKADGTPTPSAKLILGHKYQVKVSGTMNLGNWKKQGESLIDDAFFEFNEKSEPTPLHSLKNSANIMFDRSEYHPDHVYKSEPFTATQSGIHFWIYDTYYEDNNGSLQVEVSEL